MRPNPAAVDPEAKDYLYVGCYNCGSSSHWCDDCLRLPPFLREQPKGTFSSENEARYFGRLDDASAQVKDERRGPSAWKYSQLDDDRDF